MYIPNEFPPLTPASSQGSSATILPSAASAKNYLYEEPERGRSLSRSSSRSSGTTSGSSSGILILSPAPPSSTDLSASGQLPPSESSWGRHYHPRYVNRLPEIPQVSPGLQFGSVQPPIAVPANPDSYRVVAERLRQEISQLHAKISRPEVHGSGALSTASSSTSLVDPYMGLFGPRSPAASLERPEKQTVLESDTSRPVSRVTERTESTVPHPYPQHIAPQSPVILASEPFRLLSGSPSGRRTPTVRVIQASSGSVSSSRSYAGPPVVIESRSRSSSPSTGRRSPAMIVPTSSTGTRRPIVVDVELPRSDRRRAASPAGSRSPVFIHRTLPNRHSRSRSNSSARWTPTPPIDPTLNRTPVVRRGYEPSYDSTVYASYECPIEGVVPGGPSSLPCYRFRCSSSRDSRSRSPRLQSRLASPIRARRFSPSSRPYPRTMTPRLDTSPYRSHVTMYARTVSRSRSPRPYVGLAQTTSREGLRKTTVNNRNERRGRTRDRTRSPTPGPAPHSRSTSRRRRGAGRRRCLSSTTISSSSQGTPFIVSAAPPPATPPPTGMYPMPPSWFVPPQAPGPCIPPNAGFSTMAAPLAPPPLTWSTFPVQSTSWGASWGNAPAPAPVPAWMPWGVNTHPMPPRGYDPTDTPFLPRAYQPTSVWDHPGWDVPMSSMPISLCPRHPRFWHSDGNLLIQVENTQYKLHRYLFNKAKNFPALWVSSAGNSFDNPFYMSESKTDFDRFLSVLYPTDYSEHECRTTEEWTSVLSLANQWGMESVRRLAVKHLAACAGPVDKIALGHRYNIPEWLAPAYLALAMRREAITGAEGAKMGVEALVRIGALKDEVFANLTEYVDQEKFSQLFASKMAI